MSEKPESSSEQPSSFYGSVLWRFLIRPLDIVLRVPLLLLIFIYQYTLSFLIGGACRFYPTCSDFGMDALIAKPIWVAVPMISWRILRCNPFCQGGHEEVSESPSDRLTRIRWTWRRKRRTPF